MAQSPEFRTWVAVARSAPIAEVLAVRQIKVRGNGVERVGGCPNCGARGPDSDRFSINVSKNLFRCRQCNPRGGDPIAFVMWLDRCDFLAACQVLAGCAPPDGPGSTVDLAHLAAVEVERRQRREAEAARSDLYRQQLRKRLYDWWRGTLRADTSIVGSYLAARRLVLPPGCRSIRYASRAKFYGPEKGADGRYPVLHQGPCMWAAIRGPEGRFAGLHMTWIDLSQPDGKARVVDPATGEVLPARKVQGTVMGGRIELTSPAEPTHLVIGEGIETVLSRYADRVDAGEDVSRTAFWSALNLGNLGGLHDGTTAHPTLKDLGGRPVRVPGPKPGRGISIPIPDSVRHITLLGDGDSDPPLTINALARAEARWSLPGRTIVADMAPAGLDWDTARRRRLALA